MSSFTTGLPSVDSLTTNHDGQLLVLGARPGEGKTLFATKAARETVELGGNVLYFSLEMSATELHVRINLDSPKAGDGELVVNASPVVDVAQILSESAAVASRLGCLDLIVIDYLQLVNFAANRARKTMVNIALTQLSELAKQQGATVLVLAQLNRTLVEMPGTDAAPGEFREFSPHQLADAVLVVQRLDDLGYKLTVWQEGKVAGSTLLRPDPDRFFDGFIERGAFTDKEQREAELKQQRRAIEAVLNPVLNTAGVRAWWSTRLPSGESMGTALEAGDWNRVSAAATKFASQLTPYL
jgi:replicative DNA helicase